MNHQLVDCDNQNAIQSSYKSFVVMRSCNHCTLMADGQIAICCVIMKSLVNACGFDIKVKRDNLMWCGAPPNPHHACAQAQRGFPQCVGMGFSCDNEMTICELADASKLATPRLLGPIERSQVRSHAHMLLQPAIFGLDSVNPVKPSLY